MNTVGACVLAAATAHVGSAFETVGVPPRPGMTVGVAPGVAAIVSSEWVGEPPGPTVKVFSSNTICPPSGENDGCSYVLPDGLATSSAGDPPPALTSNRPRPPRSNTTSLPSGEKSGLRSKLLPVVSCVAVVHG